MTAYTIDFSPIALLTDEQFDLLCTANPELKFELTPAGELVIMPPTGRETGHESIFALGWQPKTLMDTHRSTVAKTYRSQGHCVLRRS